MDRDGMGDMGSQDGMPVGEPRLDEKSFWWTIEIAAEEGADRASVEERLWTVATLTGAIGSELLEGDGKVVLRAHYLGSVELGDLVKSVSELLPKFEGTSLTECYKTDARAWNEQVRDGFPPLNVGRAFVVMAPWHKSEDHQGRIPIYIYPASAFGTGQHESTRIALELMEDVVHRGDTVLDIGTGTGILFIAALKLGAARAVARDLDPEAIEEAKRNMNLNGLSFGLCDLSVGDLLDGVEEQGSVLTANILLSPNLAMLPDVPRVLKPKGHAVFSGMTGIERGTFLSMLSSSGLALERELHFGDWWGCRARKAWG
ncbi:MAG: 50S ribosomal protein L11 methyltransferase [Synergistaceae bacterium]|nr:50S ribosomal protein L11 methyltransferase [Synergistaceae bacterium]